MSIKTGTWDWNRQGYSIYTEAWINLGEHKESIENDLFMENYTKTGNKVEVVSWIKKTSVSPSLKNAMNRRVFQLVSILFSS